MFAGVQWQTRNLWRLFQHTNAKLATISYRAPNSPISTSHHATGDVSTMTSSTGNEYEDLKSVLASRCHSLSTMEREIFNTNESRFSEVNCYDFLMVQVVTRHGDRAPIHDTPLTRIKDFLCPRGRQKYFSSNYYDKCDNGQLTWTGCRQFHLLGRHLLQTYFVNMEGSEIEEKMRLLTTRTQRTEMSGLCLTAGLLGGMSSHQVMNVNSGPMFYDNPISHTDYVKVCPFRDRQWVQIRKQTDYQRAKIKWESAVNKGNTFLSRVGNESISNIARFYDAIVCHFCHLYSNGISTSITPCIDDMCMSPSLAMKLVKATDTFNHYYNNQNVRFV